MPKIQRIFEQDGEVCVSLGKIEGEGNLVFLTEEECQRMLRKERDYWLDEAAKISRMYPKANRQDLFAEVEKQILAVKERL